MLYPSSFLGFEIRDKGVSVEARKGAITGEDALRVAISGSAS
jgi:hypothetical protein